MWHARALHSAGTTGTEGGVSILYGNQSAGGSAAAAYLKGDYATALRLLRPLAEQGDAGAMKNRDLVAAKITPAQIAEA